MTRYFCTKVAHAAVKQAQFALDCRCTGYDTFMEDTMNKMADTVKDTVDNVRDTGNELGHRAEARGEEAKRRADGDEMTLGEKTQSVFNQGKNEVQADYDKTKRDIRTDS